MDVTGNGHDGAIVGDPTYVETAPSIFAIDLVTDEDTALKGNLLATDADVSDTLTFTIQTDAATTAGGTRDPA